MPTGEMPDATTNHMYGVYEMTNIREHNKTILKDRGFWIVKGWDSNCPRYPGIPSDEEPWESMGGRFYDWVDHCYMLQHKEVPTVYVTEPYSEHVQGDTFSELAGLVNDGWHVQISVGLSLHNPNRTVPIWITLDNESTDHSLLDTYQGID